MANFVPAELVKPVTLSFDLCSLKWHCSQTCRKIALHSCCLLFLSRYLTKTFTGTNFPVVCYADRPAVTHRFDALFPLSFLIPSFFRRAFAVLRLTCSWWVTTYVGKPSAIGQPTRPTQPFILSGRWMSSELNWMSAASVAVVVTSGERLRRKGRHGVICR